MIARCGLHVEQDVFQPVIGLTKVLLAVVKRPEEKITGRLWQTQVSGDVLCQLVHLAEPVFEISQQDAALRGRAAEKRHARRDANCRLVHQRRLAEARITKQHRDRTSGQQPFDKVCRRTQTLRALPQRVRSVQAPFCPPSSGGRHELSRRALRARRTKASLAKSLDFTSRDSYQSTETRRCQPTFKQPPTNTCPRYAKCLRKFVDRQPFSLLAQDRLLSASVPGTHWKPA